MSNPLFNDLNNSFNINPMNNFLNQFNNFRSTFNGDPEAQVKQLIQSGQMSQQQFEQIAQMANQLRQFIK